MQTSDIARPGSISSTWTQTVVETCGKPNHGRFKAFGANLFKRVSPNATANCIQENIDADSFYYNLHPIGWIGFL